MYLSKRNMTKKKQIKDLIDDGLSTINQMNNIRSNTPAGSNTRKLKVTVKKLFPLVANDFPLLSDVLSKAETRLIEDGIINAFFFGDIRTSLKILKDIFSRPPKIFISHKSEDSLFVEALVKLLRLYIGSESDKIFCSSVPNYKIGLNEEIFNAIRSQFENYDIFTIIVHSPRYYQSSICLNEMGASWILDTEFCSFLTADCEYNETDGVIDKRYISIKVNSKEASDRMNDFLVKVLDFFDLPKPELSNLSQWEADKKEFLDTVCNLTHSSN